MRFTDSAVVTLILIGLTVWLAIARPRMAPENNWPLFYYLGLVIFSKKYDEILDPYWVYAGVVLAMLIRFEFLNIGFLKFLRIIEFVVLGYVILRCLGYVFY